MSDAILRRKYVRYVDLALPADAQDSVDPDLVSLGALGQACRSFAFMVSMEAWNYKNWGVDQRHVVVELTAPPVPDPE